MSIVVKQNQIQTILVDSQGNANINARNILEAIVNLFTSFEGVWNLVEGVNDWITGNNSSATIYTSMLQNKNTNEYMRLWYANSQLQSSSYANWCFYLVDSYSQSSAGHVTIHKNNLFRIYLPSGFTKYYSYGVHNVICGLSDSEIGKELGNDLGLKLPLFQLFYNFDSSQYWYELCSLTTEGGSSPTRLAFGSAAQWMANRTLKFTLVQDDDDSKFVFIVNENSNYPTILRWSSYSRELVTPANENDQYLQGAVFNSYPDTKQRAVFRAVDGSISFGQYDTVLDGVALPAGAASDEGIVASPLFLSSQLESAGLDVPNVDNGSGYKGQIKTDWLLVSNSQVAGTTHNQGTWLNVGGGILVPWSPDAGSPFIS
jgi:hypothetical protein